MTAGRVAECVPSVCVRGERRVEGEKSIPLQSEAASMQPVKAKRGESLLDLSYSKSIHSFGENVLRLGP